MNEMIRLAGDIYFWVGLGLFISSIVSIFWILKALQKQGDGESLVSQSAPSAVPLKTLPAANEPKQSPSEMGNLKETVEKLSKQLDQIEDLLTQIAIKLAEQKKNDPNDLSAELKSLVQTLKSNSETVPASQISQIAVKINEIHQTLVSLSAPKVQK